MNNVVKDTLEVIGEVVTGTKVNTLNHVVEMLEYRDEVIKFHIKRDDLTSEDLERQAKLYRRYAERIKGVVEYLEESARLLDKLSEKM